MKFIILHDPDGLEMVFNVTQIICFWRGVTEDGKQECTKIETSDSTYGVKENLANIKFLIDSIR